MGEKMQKNISPDFSYVSDFIFYLQVENGSGILNMLQTNKHKDRMQKYYWSKLDDIFALLDLLGQPFCFSKTTQFFNKAK